MPFEIEVKITDIQRMKDISDIVLYMMVGNRKMQVVNVSNKDGIVIKDITADTMSSDMRR